MIPEPRINIEKNNSKRFDQTGYLLLGSPEYKFQNFYQFCKWNDRLAFIPTYRDRLRDLLLEGIDVGINSPSKYLSVFNFFSTFS